MNFLKPITFLIIFLSGCVSQQEAKDQIAKNESNRILINENVAESRREFYVIGQVYGDIQTIIETSFSSSSDSTERYEYHFKSDENTVEFFKNGTLAETYYHNSENQLDSVVRKYENRTTFYYDSPFNSFDPKYSIVNGVKVDSIFYQYDTINRTIKHYYNGKIATTNYVDSLGRIERSYSHAFKGYSYYEYNERGYLREKYINPRGSRVKPKSTIYSYKYDSLNNWIKKEVEIKYSGKTTSRLTYVRSIDYKF